MRKCFAIIRYEYSMQLKRIATWVVLFSACIIALIDSLPTTKNLARLEFMNEPTYYIYRSMSFDALVLLFGLVFLLSSRFPLDRKTGVKNLFMASNITKLHYICGKLLAGFLYTYTMLALFLSIKVLAYTLVAPFDVSITECIAALIKTLVICALPASLFTGFISVALPTVIDIRLFYVLISVLFFVNAFSSKSANSMPFYLITSGDLTKLIWQHPAWPFTNTGSIEANLLFLVGGGTLSGMLLFLKRKFWRDE